MKVLRIVLAVASVIAATTVVGVSPANAQQFIMPDFGTDQGWQGDKHPRFVVDITGDGRADVVGFGETGVHTAVATSNGQFQASFQVNHDFGFNTGWRVGQHDRFVTDITGDGRADIVGVGDALVYTAVSSGGGQFGPITPISTTGFTASTCAIRKMADADGDGRSDLFCIKDQRVDVALANGNGGFGQPVLATTVFPIFDFQGSTTDFTIVDVSGDRRADILGTITNSQGIFPQFLTLISIGGGMYNAEEDGGGTWRSGGPVEPDQVADVSGDGLADLVYFNDMTYVARGRGDGTFASYVIASPDFGRNTRWRPFRESPFWHPRFVVDLNGDHRSDIIGFGSAQVVTAAGRSNGQFVDPVVPASTDFVRNRGWTDAVTFPRFVTDITGDGIPDIVGFGIAGLYTAVNRGGTFS
ncbi:MAG TPA: VCBS repeat-containing protein [Kineosporiaceae bacterium]|nr:VCBS repeat-containing protein [Kineosporiaceae bacterium]